jgi:ornithine cyclodeaminase
MGADAPGKIELDPAILSNADIVVVDSRSQCIDHGEICKAYKNNKISDDKIIELGTLIENPSLGRKNDHQITVVDLTGVAVQDIQIAKAVLE